MMRALLEGLIDPGGYAFAITTAPTDALNELASGADAPEVTAISIAHYPAIAHRYQLLPHGGSMGEGYGPVVVAPSPAQLSQLDGARVAIPGPRTSAWATLRLALAAADVEVEPVVVPIQPHTRVFEALASAEVDAALLIHEGRLTFPDHGLHAVVELGVWWAEHTGGLPLPLGGNAIRRDLGASAIGEISALLRASIQHAIDHAEEAVAWLLARGGALRTPERMERYLAMYANDRTLDYGPEGRRAIALFLERAADAGVLPRCPPVDFSL